MWRVRTSSSSNQVRENAAQQMFSTVLSVDYNTKSVQKYVNIHDSFDEEES